MRAREIFNGGNLSPRSPFSSRWQWITISITACRVAWLRLEGRFSWNFLSQAIGYPAKKSSRCLISGPPTRHATSFRACPQLARAWSFVNFLRVNTKKRILAAMSNYAIHIKDELEETGDVSTDGWDDKDLLELYRHDYGLSTSGYVVSSKVPTVNPRQKKREWIKLYCYLYTRSFYDIW